jgi:hypothetical protein
MDECGKSGPHRDSIPEPSAHSELLHRLRYPGPTVGCICGPRVDSASNRNEYQEFFLGAKTAGAYGLTTFLCRLSRNSGVSASGISKGPSRPVAGKLYLYCRLYNELNFDSKLLLRIRCFTLKTFAALNMNTTKFRF